MPTGTSSCAVQSPGTDHHRGCTTRSRLARHGTAPSKTATVSLVASYIRSSKARPLVGALSIVLDGSGVPVAVVETTEIVERVLREVDAAFTRDYGEWDGTPETCRREITNYYQVDETALLLCERFKVAWR